MEQKVISSTKVYKVVVMHTTDNLYIVNVTTHNDKSVQLSDRVVREITHELCHCVIEKRATT